MPTRTLKTPEHRLDALAHQVRDLEARARALEGPGPTMEVVGWEHHPAHGSAHGGAAAFYRVAVVELTYRIVDFWEYHHVQALTRDAATLGAPGLDEDAPWPAGSRHYAASTVLTAAAVLIRLRGFVSAKQATDTGTESTARILAAALAGWRRLPETPPEVLAVVAGGAPRPEDAGVARGTARMAAAIDANTASAFEASVAAACGGDTISETAVGVACAAVAMYLREAETQQITTMGRVSGHFGAVGDRLSAAKVPKKDRDAGVVHHAPAPATVASVRTFNGDFGTTWLVKLLADSGHVFAWRASNDPGVRPGDSVVVRGTIKAHAEHKGTPETVLTRAALAPATVAVVGTSDPSSGGGCQMQVRA